MKTVVYVDTSSYCIHSSREDEEYGSWSEVLDSYVDRVRLAEHYGSSSRFRAGGYSEEYHVCGDLKENDKVFVLYCSFSDGDSFGRTEGKLEVIHVFSDYNTALEACEQMNRLGGDKYTVTITNELGEDIKLNSPLFDYFSRGEFRVEIFTL